MSTLVCGEFLDHLCELARSDAIRALHADDKTATAFALNLVAQISDAWGGINVYISRSTAREFRDRAIVAAFDGGNYVQLAVKHRLSERMVRKIIAERRETDRRLLTRG